MSESVVTISQDGETVTVVDTVAEAVSVAGNSGPQGDPGPQGETGPQGPQGIQGPTGVVATTAPATYDSGTKTVGVTVGTTANTVAAGDDSRITGAAQKANNLADVADAATARANLGLGTMATATATDYLSKAGNLSGIADAAVARTNLGLGTMATQAANAYAALTGATFTGAAMVDGTADAIQLRVQGHSTQTNSVQTWETSAGVVIARISAAGFMGALGGFGNPTGGNPYILPGAGSFVAISQNAAHVPWSARGAAAQSAALQTWENSSGSALASISATGRGEFSDIKSVGANLNFINQGGSTTFQVRASDVNYIYRLYAANGSGTDAFVATGNSRFGVLNAGHIPVQVRGFASQSAPLHTWEDASTAVLASVTPAGLHRWNAAGNQQTTVGAAGGASALPATPTKYLKVVDSTGATLVIPAYAAA